MDEDMLQKLGEKLRKARKKCGLTQSQVANLLGINQAQLCYYETGKREINISLLQELANIYGYSINHFLDIEVKGDNKIEIAFRADDFCEEDLETIAFAKTFLRNLCEMMKLAGGRE